MKTPVTMRFDDELVDKAKAEALRRRITLTRLVEDAVRTELNRKECTELEPCVLPVFNPAVPGYAPGFPVDGTYAEILDFLDAHPD